MAQAGTALLSASAADAASLKDDFDDDFDLDMDDMDLEGADDFADAEMRGFSTKWDKSTLRFTLNINLCFLAYSLGCDSKVTVRSAGKPGNFPSGHKWEDLFKKS